MAVNNSWRQIRTMDDWMRDMEKRLIHEERRPIPRSAYEVVGRGFTPYANQVTDWNSEGPTINGFFYSDADKIINSPDDGDNWVGIVEATPIGQGVQRVWKYVDSSDTDGDGIIDTWTPVADPTLYTRSFITNADGTRTYTVWAAASGGGGGISGINVEDEGVSLGSFTTVNFTGSGVTAVDSGSGEVQVSIPGGAAGTTTAAHAFASRRNGTHTVATGTFEPLSLDTLDDQSGSVTVSIGVPSPPGSVFTINEDGVYDLSSSVAFEANGTGRRVMQVTVNGTVINQQDHATTTSGTASASVATTWNLVTGDKVQFLVWQNSGGSLQATLRADLYWARVTKVDAAKGDPGVPGPEGPPNPGQSLEVTFPSPLADWTITHNWGSKMVEVNCFDPTGIEEFDPDIDYPDNNTVVVHWYAPKAGIARLMGPSTLGAPVPAPVPRVFPFSYTGALTVYTGTARFYNDIGPLTITSVRASVGTSPAGAGVVVDVLKNGTTIFAGGTDRPNIPAGSNTDTGVPTVTAWAVGEYLTVSIVGIGSTTPGSDLTVQVVAS